jgi:dihydrofolate reductase
VQASKPQRYQSIKKNMRKLKLEVQMSVDGYIADAKGSMSWMIWPYSTPVWNWDKALQQYHIDLQTSSDCILLSRNMAGGFHDFWEQVAGDAADPRYAFAKPITDMKKIVFSRKLKKSTWKNTTLVTGDYVKAIRQIKNEEGEDIICYGGATFISSLIQSELIDEYHLIINPTIVGKGLPIFQTITRMQQLTLNKAIGFECGVVVLHYELNKKNANNSA